MTRSRADSHVGTTNSAMTSWSAVRSHPGRRTGPPASGRLVVVATEPRVELVGDPPVAVTRAPGGDVGQPVTVIVTRHGNVLVLPEPHGEAAAGRAVGAVPLPVRRAVRVRTASWNAPARMWTCSPTGGVAPTS